MVSTTHWPEPWLFAFLLCLLCALIPAWDGVNHSASNSSSIIRVSKRGRQKREKVKPTSLGPHHPCPVKWHSKSFAALGENLSLIFSTHMIAHNLLSLQFQWNQMPSSGLQGHQAYTFMHIEYNLKALEQVLNKKNKQTNNSNNNNKSAKCHFKISFSFSSKH